MGEPLPALPAGYAISTDAAKLDREYIHRFLTGSYWAEGISRAIVDKAIDHALNFGLYDPAGKQVGFARVVTDRATFAYLADVFVDEAERGKGLGKALMAEIMRHPDLQGLRRHLLATRDAHGLYAQFGFTPLRWPDRLMEILDLEVYSRAPKP